MLDIGCGFGWHCGHAVEHNASYVVGTDISEKMLEKAKEKFSSPKIQFQCTPMEDLEFEPDSFDVVLSSLALHYTPDFGLICEKINQYLTTGGDFIFSVEHPVFTAFGTQDWIYNSDNNPKYWPVDNYFTEGERNAVFLGENVVKYHKTLTTYLNTLLEHGFVITKIVEPKPADHLLKTVPEMKNELRRPMMLLVSSKKI